MTDDSHEPATVRITCPKCGSNDIRRSKNEGVVGTLLGIFGRWPFRCRSCRAKFYRHASAPSD